MRRDFFCVCGEINIGGQFLYKQEPNLCILLFVDKILLPYSDFLALGMFVRLDFRPSHFFHLSLSPRTRLIPSNLICSLLDAMLVLTQAARI